MCKFRVLDPGPYDDAMMATCMANRNLTAFVCREVRFNGRRMYDGWIVARKPYPMVCFESWVGNNALVDVGRADIWSIFSWRGMANTLWFKVGRMHWAQEDINHQVHDHMSTPGAAAGDVDAYEMWESVVKELGLNKVHPLAWFMKTPQRRAILAAMHGLYVCGVAKGNEDTLRAQGMLWSTCPGDLIGIE